MVIIEISRPIQLKAGFFKSKINGKIFIRFWWLWFAIAWTPLCLKTYDDTIRSGKTEWKNS